MMKTKGFGAFLHYGICTPSIFIAILAYLSPCLAEVNAIACEIFPRCVSVAIAVVLRRNVTVFTLLYWPLKISSIVRIFYVPIVPTTTPLKAMLGDFLVFYLSSLVSSGALRRFYSLDIEDQENLEPLHTFVLNLIWAMEAAYLVRAIYLLLRWAHDEIKVYFGQNIRKNSKRLGFKKLTGLRQQ